MNQKRIVAHLDMDAFFAAIEERDNPQFRGLPIVVGADPKDGKGRGVVSTANYKAREYGIHSAMPISVAWRLSEKARKQGKPPVVFLPTNYFRYSQVSKKIRKIIQNYASVIEQASVDEFYLDLSFAKSFKKAREICFKVKEEIREKGKLTCSIGLAPNKLIAKVASAREKPDRFTIVFPSQVNKFLEQLSIREIPGIGPKTEAYLVRQGIKLVKDLKKVPKNQLKEMFGKWGLDLYEKLRGRDYSPVTEEYEVKSFGEQETFLKDTLNSNFISERLAYLCKNVTERFNEEGFKGFRTIVLTIRFTDFETRTKSLTFKESNNDYNFLKIQALKLLLPFLDHRENPRGKLIRLIGVRVEKLA